MDTFRLKLRPRSPWRTPWQADTLAGMLMAVCARLHGADFLRDRLIRPMLEGRPPFVLSDACPGDFLPAPIWLRLAQWPPNVDRKRLKRARWLPKDHFEAARNGNAPPVEALIEEDAVLRTSTRQHNTLDRLTDTTGEADTGLGPYNRPEIQLQTPVRRTQAPGPHLDGAHYLSVYCRILEPGAEDLLLELVDELALTGFGADTATGRGQFELVGDPENTPDFDTAPEQANTLIALSTFQPAENDPVDGLWDAFPKFAKFGPDLGLDDVRKNTLVLFRPGACFKTGEAPRRPFLGRAIPPGQLVHQETIGILAQRGIQPIHPAFALTVSAKLDWEQFP